MRIYKGHKMDIESTVPWSPDFLAIHEEYAQSNSPGHIKSHSNSSKASKKQTVSKPLACIRCRRKKVKVRHIRNAFFYSFFSVIYIYASKCLPSQDGSVACRLCARVGEDCIVPAVDERKLSNSRKLIAKLYERIDALEAELKEHRTLCPRPSEGQREWLENVNGALSPDTSSPASETSSNTDNMIVRLCGGQRQLNSDRVGRLRFFGPTSSLHLSESVTSSVLIREPNGSRGRYQWQDMISEDLQDHLLELYWKYQHHTIPLIYKEGTAPL
jgi:hypothetical protein